MKWLRRVAIVFAVVLGPPALLAFCVFAPPLGEHHMWVDTGEKVVALSFDDGPNPPHTEALLELLDREEIQATFFMTGEHVESHPETVERVRRAGHEIGNHSWDETRLALLTPDEVRDRLARTDRALRAAGVTGSIDVRAPSLMRGPSGAWVLWRDGRRHVGGSAAGIDWTRAPAAPDPACGWWRAGVDSCPTQDPEKIAARILEGAGPGGILVFHDGHDAFDGADRSGTVEAAAIVIRALRERGFHFLTVGELLERYGG